MGKRAQEETEPAGSSTQKTIQKTIRMPESVPVALKEIADALNKDRDTLSQAKLDPTKLITLAIRDLLEKHGKFGHYPSSNSYGHYPHGSGPHHGLPYPGNDPNAHRG